ELGYLGFNPVLLVKSFLLGDPPWRVDWVHADRHPDNVIPAGVRHPCQEQESDRQRSDPLHYCTIFQLHGFPLLFWRRAGMRHHAGYVRHNSSCSIAARDKFASALVMPAREWRSSAVFSGG